jgi:hypothetical protein
VACSASTDRKGHGHRGVRKLRSGRANNLILNINVYIEDARQKKMEFVKSVDIRGNTDESWQRGLDYMLRHYLLRDSDDNAP